MESHNWRALTVAVVGAAMLFSATSRPAHAQSSFRGITLYEDVKTGALYRTPGRGRIPVTLGLEPAEEVKKQVQQEVTKHDEALRAEFMDNQKTLLKQNAELTKQVAEMKPAVDEFGKRWLKKISIGTLVYGDYRFMSHTGFGPQFLTQTVWPGPGNNAFNAFDITRGYLDFKFTPTEDFLLRVTPNVYTMIGKASSDAVGNSTNWGSTLDGNLGYRLKYAYIDYTTFFRKVLQVDAMKEDKFTFGQQQNPLVDWQENLYGFRYVNLTPWNYRSLSSTQVGLAMKGPIKFDELQYVDYDFGVYNNASFHALEQGNTKQTMARVTLNPLGAKSRYDSLGITAFVDYGWGNNAPDQSAPEFGGGKTNWRNAFLVHYTAKYWGLGAEYDIGKNAFSSGNLYSGSGPNPASSFGAWNSMVKGILDNGQSNQRGVDFFGHVDVPNTPLTLFGMYDWFMPNTKVDKNPLDFQRWIVGVQYRVNSSLRFALDSQNIDYYHSQFTFPATTFGESGKVSETPFAVPRDTHAVYLNVEFSY
jgi:hypothetical protein